MKNILKELNKEQKSAVKFGKGPLLIIAGAGTGKTSVITERIKYLILSGLAKPSEILALTFTEKAAKEMEERVDLNMPYGYTQMWITTFHSFCDRLLKQEAVNVGFDPGFKLISQAEEVQLLRSNIFDIKLDYFRPLGNPNKFIHGMLQHFSRLQDEDVSPEDYFAWSKKQKAKTIEEKLEKKKWIELSNAYKFYDNFKNRKGYMNFGDLITKALILLRKRPNVLAEYRKRFKYILVDEFQDTNFSQNELIKLLVGKNGNINVVADDDQSIYRFRGAAVSNVLLFRKSFPKTKIVVLTKNYRSTQAILDASYKLIQFNNPDRLEVIEKINKKLVSNVSYLENEVDFLFTENADDEAESVARKINTLREEFGYSYKDFAILVRANAHSDVFIRSLNRQGIPSQFLGPEKLFKQKEIIEVVSYLKVLQNIDDSTAFYILLSIKHFEISGVDLSVISNNAKKKHISLFKSAEKVNQLEVSADTKTRVNNLVNIVKKHLDIAKNESAGRLLYLFLEETGMLQSLLSPDNPHAEKIANNIAKLFDKIKSFESSRNMSNVTDVVEYINLLIELGEDGVSVDVESSDYDSVNILTVHSSKGLEFPVVFVVNLVSQRFPTVQRKEQIPIPEELVKEVLPIGDYHLEEERRLFYVAMTRAKERLFLTAANYYGDAKRQKKLSQFLFESLGGKLTEYKKEKSQHEQLSFLEYKEKKDESLLGNRPLTVNYLSYSQIESFRTCPTHYKVQYIYKLPTDQTASQSFGVSIHSTLKFFYDKVAEGVEPSEKLILSLLKQNWIGNGYENKKHENDFYKKGKIYLSGYLSQGFIKGRLPLLMEQKFTIPLFDDAQKTNRLNIGGVIDRVDDIGDDTIEIIDYKTGANIPTQKEVDKNLQLSIYALAATNIPDKPFGKKLEKIKLSLYFLDTQEKISTTRSLKQIEKAKQEIFEVKKEIENSDFKCSNHMFCQNGCEFLLFCNSEKSSS